MDKKDKKQRKAEAERLYVEELMKRPAGVFCIRNKQNGKVFIHSSDDITSKMNRFKKSLESNGIFPNKALQEEYNTLGEEAFEFEILEEVRREEDEIAYAMDENFTEIQKRVRKKAKDLEEKWLENLQPYGDRGYHRKKSKRQLTNRRKDSAETVLDVEPNNSEHLYFSLKDLSEVFWNASIEEMKAGFVKHDGKYICLVCGKCFDENVIYPKGNVFYNAKKAIEEHILDAHGSMIEVLLNMDKKYTGLSQIQTDLVTDFYQGLDDEAVAKKAGIAKSTVRNHRFRLKEKQKQAKVFLALMSLVDEKQNEDDKIIAIHKTPRMLDERYAISQGHQKEVMEKFIKPDGTLLQLPKKEKDKIIILFHFASLFEYNKKYKEIEVNQVIKSIYDDFVTVRRYLIEYGFMERTKDCSLYWVV
ncbi:DUF2087 domain-containing protein [Vallitalea okinawensis]|uniref:DUF2087 domain-containing protein n=1 Tax=Vallitalea okinawensis TaxID=2078660 RepID=UPI001FA8E5F5|nr:DUF2087 domain-containing protein [Vallitalea okinawensis]